MRQVKIYDTTLRDGTQAEDFNLSLADKIRIAQKLAYLGIHYIEGGWPGSNPKDKDFFSEIRNYELGVSRIAAFGSTHHKDRPPEVRPRLAGTPHQPGAGGDHLRQVVPVPGQGDPPNHPGAQPGAHHRLPGLSQAPGGRAVLRRRALLRRLQGRPGLRPEDPGRGPDRGGADTWCCATPTAAP